jgi:hypothetical protein
VLLGFAAATASVDGPEGDLYVSGGDGASFTSADSIRTGDI